MSDQMALQQGAVGYKGGGKGKGKGQGVKGKGKGGGDEGDYQGGHYRECYLCPRYAEDGYTSIAQHFWVSGELSRAQSLVDFVD